MKFRTLLKGFKPLGSMLLIGCIMVGLMTALGSKKRLQTKMFARELIWEITPSWSSVFQKK